MNTYHETRQPYGIEEVTRHGAAIILRNWWSNPRQYQVARVAKGHYMAINAARDYSIEILIIGSKA